MDASGINVGYNLGYPNYDDPAHDVWPGVMSVLWKAFNATLKSLSSLLGDLFKEFGGAF